jgi:hypothetical protein
VAIDPDTAGQHERPRALAGRHQPAFDQQEIETRP